MKLKNELANFRKKFNDALDELDKAVGEYPKLASPTHEPHEEMPKSAKKQKDLGKAGKKSPDAKRSILLAIAKSKFK